MYNVEKNCVLCIWRMDLKRMVGNHGPPSVDQIQNFLEMPFSVLNKGVA